MDTPQNSNFELWRLPTVKAKTTFSESSIYRLMGEGKFPKSLKVGARKVAWRSDEVEAFLDSLPRSTVGDTEAFYTADKKDTLKALVRAEPLKIVHKGGNDAA